MTPTFPPWMRHPLPFRITSDAFNEKLNKAQGPDQIPAKVLKELSTYLSLQICVLCNQSIEEECVPSDWKAADVTFLFINICFLKQALELNLAIIDQSV